MGQEWKGNRLLQSQPAGKAKPSQEDDELEDIEELRKGGFLGDGDGTSALLKVRPRPSHLQSPAMFTLLPRSLWALDFL